MEFPSPYARTISALELFEKGLSGIRKEMREQAPKTHNFRARLTPEGGLEVTDPDGARVDVRLSATSDMRSVHAFVPSVGFIGGWEYPHRKMPWSHLVDCINEGKVYYSTEDLPNGRKKAVTSR